MLVCLGMSHSPVHFLYSFLFLLLKWIHQLTFLQVHWLFVQTTQISYWTPLMNFCYCTFQLQNFYLSPFYNFFVDISFWWKILFLVPFSSLLMVLFSPLSTFKVGFLRDSFTNFSFFLWMSHTSLFLCMPYNLLKTGHIEYYNVTTLDTGILPLPWSLLLLLVVSVVYWLFHKVYILCCTWKWSLCSLSFRVNYCFDRFLKHLQPRKEKR